MVKEIKIHLHRQLKKGAYKKITDPEKFAVRITKELQDISKDLHLKVSYLSGTTHKEPPRDPEEFIRHMEFKNNGFEELKRLPGNIGYLKLNNFMHSYYGGDTAVAAMNFLANTDALIIDLRDNQGGSPTMIQLISSYFFDIPVHLSSFYVRKDNITTQSWTFSHVPSPRLSNTPLYILISKKTFSAAEEFVYNLKCLKRAIVIGEATRGGAHPVNFYDFPQLKFGIDVPYARSINPVTKSNWEGKGVQPDIESPGENALEKAYEKALQDLMEKSKDDTMKQEEIRNDLDDRGIELLEKKQTKSAIKIFQVNVRLFPNAYQVYDSLAEAYLEANNKALAEVYFNKSLQLNPDNSKAKEMMEKLKNKK
jgi:C-terminal processing protease CtpA/Prc